MSLKDFSSVKKRREFLENMLSLSLPHIGSFSLDEDVASSRNCENMVGATQIPLGIAGPLKINPSTGGKNYYVPLATSEGALVASVNRGCKALTESGGTSVLVENVGVTRGPVFKTKGIGQSMEFKSWLDDHIEDLKKIAQKTSSHLTLIKLETSIVGKYVYVRFYFDTAEAMGMNMATFASTAITGYIENALGIRCLSIAGNFDTDKKPSWLNIISGRGKRVWAEALISQKTLEKTLKTKAQAVFDTWLSKCMLGSALSGSMGFNAHFANIIAALFIATGQDAAHVVEGSIGFTTTQVIDKDLYISVFLPDLLVGTIGGGTALATQKEALEILGIKSEKKSAVTLAQITGGAVLAGELSLLASLSEGSLAGAHQKLARGKKLKIIIEN